MPARLEGDRVDKALADLLDLSRGRARALIEGGVLMDGLPARPADRVRAGAVLEAPSPEEVNRALILSPGPDYTVDFFGGDSVRSTFGLPPWSIHYQAVPTTYQEDPDGLPEPLIRVDGF